MKGYSVVLSHPTSSVSEISRNLRWDEYTNGLADSVIEQHFVHTDLMCKITKEEIIDMGHYIEALEIADVQRQEIHLGLEMVLSWKGFCYEHDDMKTWDVWYIQAQRSATIGWHLRIILADSNKTQADLEMFISKLWDFYKKYFRRVWVDDSESPLGVPFHETDLDLYRGILLRPKGRHLEDGTFEWDRVDVHDTIQALGEKPAFGSIFRTARRDEDCILWCDTNDGHYKTKADKLWQPRDGGDVTEKDSLLQ